jgi:hypothetical protein
VTHSFVVPGAAAPGTTHGWVRHGAGPYVVRVDGDRVRVRLVSMRGGQLTWSGHARVGPDGLLLAGRVHDATARALAWTFAVGAASIAALGVVLVVEGGPRAAVVAAVVVSVVLATLAWTTARRWPGDAAAHRAATERIVAEWCGVSRDAGSPDD